MMQNITTPNVPKGGKEGLGGSQPTSCPVQKPQTPPPLRQPQPPKEQTQKNNKD